MSVNVRVEARYTPGHNHGDRMKAIGVLLRQFKREFNNAGVAQQMKRYECYEKPCERRRRKERASELAKIFAQLEQAPQQGGKSPQKTTRVAKQARKSFGRA